MAMKLTDNRRVISFSFSIFVLFIGLMCFGLANAIGSGDDLKMDRDSGIIGEKKTIQGEKVRFDESTGITYHVRNKGTFVTPKVISDIAYFGSYQAGYSTSLGYGFRFPCVGWKYSIIAYWSSPDVTKERVGFSVSLESPDKKIFVDVKEIDIPMSEELVASLTSADSFSDSERIIAAQQTIRWILDRSQDKYGLTDKSIKFTREQIGSKEFVKGEVEVFSRKENAVKKCVIWALNYRIYKFRDRSWMENWVCQVVSDLADYSSTVAKTQMILETLKFDHGKNVHPDLMD